MAISCIYRALTNNNTHRNVTDGLDVLIGVTLLVLGILAALGILNVGPGGTYGLLIAATVELTPFVLVKLGLLLAAVRDKCCSKGFSVNL